MITISTGDLFADFDSGVTQAIVIPVNCVGVMGKGVALEAKKRWPKLHKKWQSACESRSVKAGAFYFFENHDSILLSTTKDHWRSPSKIEWVESICKQLAEPGSHVKSIGLPALGCGAGELNWIDVKALIEKYLSDSPIHFICYEPK